MIKVPGSIDLAKQQINFGDHAAHSIQIKQKELFFTIWEQFKNIFSPNLTFLERLKALGHVFIEFINYPLFKLDSEHISLFNIFVGIVLLMIGLKYARILSHKSTRELVKLTKIDKTSEEALKKIIHYIFMMIMIILVLDIAHVPVTVFTVLGGALAIGIGLGTQNISNDFISGLIIMFERPFKIGDVIEIENAIGSVQQIGTRCTFLKNGEGKDIMVPNSELLKNRIINWSYNGEFIKNSAIIPVEYGSPIVLVTEILEKALISHPGVIKDGYIPRAFLVNFDDKALNFEMVFVLNLKGQDKKEILHQIHARILNDFTIHNIRLASKKGINYSEKSQLNLESTVEEDDNSDQNSTNADNDED